MINAHRLISNATVSVVQAVISGLVLFLLYRYLIDHLGAQQLGLWSVILASTSVARLSDMGLSGSVVKFVARYRALQDDVQAGEIVQTAAISIAIVMAVLILAVYPLLDDVLLLAIPAESLDQSLTILPWAVSSLWLGSVSGVFHSGLDGCQRMDIRNYLMIAGNVIFLTAAFWLVPRYGLLGLAIGQTVQGILLMCASWLLLRQNMNTLPWFPIRWSKIKFKEMFGYAVNFQINTIAILLFEPVTKLLMSRYGGLSSAAYYEMGHQLVIKLRALLVTANQALVPAVAELHELDPGKVRELYLKAYRMLYFVALPFFASILIALPVISVLWIGHFEAQFLFFGILLTVSWGFNSITITTYFVNQGTGDLNWNTIAHVSMAIMNIAFGLVLGEKLGGYGVAIGSMLALVFASCVVLIAFHKRCKLPFRLILPKEHFLLTGTVVLCISFSSWFYASNLNGQSIVGEGAVCMGIYIFLMGIVIWLHPYRLVLVERVRKARISK